MRAELVEGSAHRAVADAAASLRRDLVVIGSHGRGGLQQFFLGGTAAHILVQATCPALPDSASELNADLMVFGKHGTHVLEELLLDSVTKHVLSDSQCDVLAICDPCESPDDTP